MRNNKLLELIEKGLTLQSAKNLTESEINVLHRKLIGEQVTQINKPSFKVSGSGTLTTPMPKGATVTKKPDGSVMITPNEGEIGEGKKKKSEPDPISICHSQVGPKKTRKFERCVKSVTKSLKEGKNPVSLFLENEIMRIVEKHIPPRITKGDLLQYISEDTKTAPSKPKTKPKTDPKTKPGHPGKNPSKDPKDNPAPKAGKEMGENTTTKPKTKPTTKPETKPRPKSPGHNPNPGENPAPKAISPERAKTEVIKTIMKILDNE
jgi:hypothetical protein